MIQIGIVVFRETLEVALVAALLLAATRGIPRRGLWFLTGLAGGAGAAGIVALFAETITEALAGRGQDLFNAAVLSLTVVMVAWTIAWMRKHGATLAREARDAGDRIRSGQAPLYLLAVTVGVAVMRDGSELVVFLTALGLSGQVTAVGILGGFVAGVIAGTIVGALIYFGILRAGIKSIFQLAAILLAFLGAGLAAQAAGFLIAAGWLPPLIDPLWNTSAVLPDESGIGQTAHALFGYISQPSAIQVVIYLAVLAVICWLGFRSPTAAARERTHPAE
jgi:high-affinity iron transporter